MNNINEFDYEVLKSLIEKMIENKVNEILKNSGIENSFRGTVISFSDPYAIVRFSNGVEFELINHSGEKLSEGDNVIVYGSKTDISNRYIGVRLC